MEAEDPDEINMLRHPQLSLINETNEHNSVNNQPQEETEPSNLNDSENQTIKNNRSQNLTKSNLHYEQFVHHAGKYFATTLDHYVKLKEFDNKKEITLESDLRSFKFQVTQAINPYKFFVIALAENHSEYAQMFDELNSYYVENEKFIADLAKKSNYNFAIHNVLAVAKSPKTHLFSRVCFQKFVDADLEYEDFLSVDMKDNQQKVVVYFIDAGEIVEIELENLYPIAMEYCQKVPRSIRCSLDKIEPIDNDNSSQLNEDFLWSKDANAYFFKLIETGQIYEGTFFSTEAPENCVKKIKISWDDPLKILVYNNNEVKYGQYMFLNEKMAMEGLAKLCDLYDNQKDELSETQSRVDPKKNQNTYFSGTVKITDIIPLETQAEFDKRKDNRILNYISDCTKRMAESI